MPIIQFGWPDPQTIKSNYADDPDLFWVTKDYKDKLRAALVRCRDRLQVTFVPSSASIEEDGEPCDYQSSGTDGHPPGGRGWSSEQGVMQLKREIVRSIPCDRRITAGTTTGSPSVLRIRSYGMPAVARARRTRAPGPGRSRRGSASPAGGRSVPCECLLKSIPRTCARSAARLPAPGSCRCSSPRRRTMCRGTSPLPGSAAREQASDVPSPSAICCADPAGGAGGRCRAVRCLEAFEGLPDRIFRADGIHFTDCGDAALGQIVGGCVACALTKRGD